MRMMSLVRCRSCPAGAAENGLAIESKRRSHSGLGPLLLVLGLVLGAERAALAAPIDFETSEGYAVGNLHGQPIAGDQWGGDITPKIAVTSAQAQSGGQSVLIDPGLSSGKVSNDLSVGPVPNRFSVKFHWRPSGTQSGYGAVYLSQFADSETNFIGPWVQFVASGSVYQIKYVEGGFVGNIKLGMSPAVYENNWWEVEIVGDLSTRTFDFYLDGTLEASGLSFRNSINNLATRLDYLGFQAATSGVADHYFDNFEITRTPPPVPALPGWGPTLLLLLLVGTVAWTWRARLPAT